MSVIYVFINEVSDKYYSKYKLKFDRWYVGYDYNRYKRECYNEMSNRYGEGNFEQTSNFQNRLNVNVIYKVNVEPFVSKCINDGKSLVIE